MATDVQGLDVVLRVELLDAQRQPLSLFHDAGVKVDVADDYAVLVGVRQALYLAEKSERDEVIPPNGNAGDAPAEATTANLATTPAVHLSDGHELQLDEDEMVTDVKWIEHDHFCASYSSGTIRILNRQGKLVFEQKFHTTAVTKLDVSRNASTTVAARRVEVQLPDGSASTDGELWVLYEDSTLAIIQISQLLGGSSTVFGPAQANKFRKYALRDQTDIVAAVPCGPARPTIFQSHPRIGVYTIISAGSSPFVSFYQAGNDQNSIIHLAHIATVMATRAAGAVWSFAKSWGWSNTSNGDISPENAVAENASGYLSQADTAANDSAAEHVAAPLGTIRWVAEDNRRRCRVLVLSPTGRLAAVSDTLGRIMLIDTSRMMVIRMWKGYRNAQCGWMHGSEGVRRPKGLYLVIYSAQRGIVEVWRARYGPRVYSFAVGGNATLFTRFDTSAKKASCLVLTESSRVGVSELIALQPNVPNASILLKYFTQNKLQEENFLLHQIIASLQAFVKRKKIDRVHTLEQDAIEPLMDDMATLSSSTTIQALLEVLLSADMMFLSAAFLLKALSKLQMALQNGMSSHTPSGAELSLLWRMQWQHRILSAFVGLQTEFNRSKHVLATNKDKLDSLLEKQGNKRIIPWLELFRRAGYNMEDGTFERSKEIANTLTALEFLEFFSMPFTDPEIPRRRDILALYDQAEKTEDFLRRALIALKTPVLRRISNGSQRAGFLTFLFTPVLSSVFAIQELQQLHASIFLTLETQTFLDWYFSLPLRLVLAMPPPSLSSSLQRWLQTYFASLDLDNALDYDGSESSPRNRLTRCPEPLGEIFEACWKSPKLFHAFVLCEHCAWGENEHAKQLEDLTLGKYENADGGLRWRVLQSCLAKTVHLSLRLGRMGRLSVESVENVDDSLRSLAVMQLNDARNTGDNESSLADTPMHSVHDVDSWVAAMEHCRNGAQMRDWSSVLHWFPQFADEETFRCFRASVLCAAWNAERADMHQLDDALVEVESIISSSLRASIAVYIWEKYIRVHVVTLVSFWEESALGRKPQRGLQPKIARRFFRIIKRLLVILTAAVKARYVQKQNEKSEHSYLSDASEQDDEELEDEHARALGSSIENENDEPGISEFKVAFLTQRKQWKCPVKNLQPTFESKWPPSFAASTLMHSLTEYNLDMVSRLQIADHLSLILLLDSFAATSVTPVSIVKLFSNKGKHLCRPDSFVAVESLEEPTSKEKRALETERMQFLRQLLAHDDTLGFALAEAFEVELELVREEHVLCLYEAGRDEYADASIEKMKHPERLVLKLGSIARARLALILRRMKAEPEYAMLMSVLPADVFAWVVNDKMPPLIADSQVDKLDHTPSLTATHMLLLKCLSLMPPTGVEFTKITEMSVLVKDVISQVKQARSKS